MSFTETELDQVFKIIEARAVDGARCPENGTFGITHGVIPALARCGRIRVEISGRNFRRVHILTGPNTGYATAADPTGAKPWKIIDDKELRTIKRVNPTLPASIRQPAATV